MLSQQHKSWLASELQHKFDLAAVSCMVDAMKEREITKLVDDAYKRFFFFKKKGCPSTSLGRQGHRTHLRRICRLPQCLSDLRTHSTAVLVSAVSVLLLSHREFVGTRCVMSHLAETGRG